MGLCKCPKRKTTSHFCFHHCVNVCEHCIVNNHTTCVVKSYTTWLKEASGSSSSSSVSPSALCAVCQKQFVLTAKEVENLTNNYTDHHQSSLTSSCDTKTAIRLLCYHIVHARCLSIYVKKQLKEGNILKCPSCARQLWLQQEQQKEQSQDSNDTGEMNSNELSPVALQLHKHLIDHGGWWGQALINNGIVENIEKHLLEIEDENEETVDEESQHILSDQAAIEFIPQNNTLPNSIPPLTIDQRAQSPNSNNSYLNYNNADITHSTSSTTNINHRSNTHQTYQPIYHRNFNNNYGIDHPAFSQQQQQQQCSSINMAASQGSDLNNRHTITSSTTLLLNNDNTSSHDEEQQHPSGKYRPKKFNKTFSSLNYQRMVQFFRGTNNRAEDSSNLRIATIIIFCVFIIVILLVAITSYTRSNNEPFDNNSIDYGGGFYPDNNGGGAAVVKNDNIHNL